MTVSHFCERRCRVKEEVAKKSRRDEKKELKEKKFFEAAYDLFTSQGIHETAISDIVKKAGVAKGTFYLYFKDKPHMIERLVLRKSYTVLKEALHITLKQEFSDFAEAVIFFVNYLIDYFKENKLLLKLIDKNLSWGIFRRAIGDDEHFQDIRELVGLFMEGYCQDREKTQAEAQQILFIIVEMVGSVCHSTIVLEEPTDIDTLKPILFTSIRKMLAA